MKRATIAATEIRRNPAAVRRIYKLELLLSAIESALICDALPT
jgi:hypothetical protein